MIMMMKVPPVLMLRIAHLVILKLGAKQIHDQLKKCNQKSIWIVILFLTEEEARYTALQE